MKINSKICEKTRKNCPKVWKLRNKPYICTLKKSKCGLMAEWLGTALQKLLQRFESASDLTKTALEITLTLFFFYFVIHL